MNTDVMNLMKVIASVAGILIGGSVAFAAIKVAFAAGKTVTALDQLRGETAQLRGSLDTLAAALGKFAEKTQENIGELEKEVTRIKYGRRSSDRGQTGEGGQMAATGPADTGGDDRS